MNPLKALTLAAATTRLTTLVTKDELTAPLRMKVEDWAQGKPYASFPERVSYLIDCHRCASVWVGAIVLVLAALGRPGWAVLNMLALSQFAMTAIEVLEDKTSD